MTKTIVIYHKADFDGIFCREIAHKFLPDAELIGWDYGDPTPGVPHRPELDFSGIAKRHGGGGHKQACGFTCDSLPFLSV